MPEFFDLRSDTAIQPTAAMVESLRGLRFADDLLRGRPDERTAGTCEQ